MGAAIAAALFAASSLITAPASLGALSNPGPGQCAQVAFIGVRGSAEKKSDSGGYGKEIDPIRASFVNHLPRGVTHKEIAIDYTAASVNELRKVYSGGVDRYFASIFDGNSKLLDVLFAERRCAGEKIVVAGYSQGALVVNQVIRNFDLPKIVKGILLVADPVRVPHQVGKNYGDAAPGFGIYQLIDTKIKPLPSDLGPAVVQLCDSGDTVCDWSHRGSLYTAATKGVATHTSYASRDAGLLAAMGIRAVRSAGYTPKF